MHTTLASVFGSRERWAWDFVRHLLLKQHSMAELKISEERPKRLGVSPKEEKRSEQQTLGAKTLNSKFHQAHTTLNRQIRT